MSETTHDQPDGPAVCMASFGSTDRCNVSHAEEFNDAMLEFLGK